MAARKPNGTVGQTKLFGKIKDEVKAAGARLLVLDTLANLHALDPNSQEEAKAFVSLLIGLAYEADCAILLLAHPSRTGLATGDGDGFSVGWNNAVRSRSYLAADKNNPELSVLALKKSNYGKRGAEVRLQWQRGLFELVSADVANGADAKRIFLSILDRFTEAGRYVNTSYSTAYAPSQFAEEPEATEAGVSKDQLKSAMIGLLHAGIVVLEDYQKPNRQPGKRLARGAFALPDYRFPFDGEGDSDDLV